MTKKLDRKLVKAIKYLEDFLGEVYMHINVQKNIPGIICEIIVVNPKDYIKKYNIAGIKFEYNGISIESSTITIAMEGSAYNFNKAITFEELFGNIRDKYGIKIQVSANDNMLNIFPQTRLADLKILYGEVYFYLQIKMPFKTFKTLIERKDIYRLLDEILQIVEKYRVDIRKTKTFQNIKSKEKGILYL